MHYINVMPSAFKNMADYINMSRSVLINRGFHELCNLANDGATSGVEQAPPNLFEQLKYGPDTGLNIFSLDSYHNALQKPRHIRFSRRYRVGYDITRPETPLPEWDIVQMRTCGHGV